MIGVTLGDPAGIGPEIVVSALADPRRRAWARFQVYGVNDVLSLAADRLGIEPFWHRVEQGSPRSERSLEEPVVILDHERFPDLLDLEATPSRMAGLASKAFVEHAIEDALRPPGHPRRLDALVTAPISKAAWSLAGYDWPGHTELLTRRTGARRVAMMFCSPGLRVVLATGHLPLMDLRNVLTIGRIFDAIDLGHEACRTLEVPHPRIAVAGLNPHASEAGRFGDEEERLVEPAVRMARETGIDVSGPHSPDSVFRQALDGDFDLVVALHHDQGLIPFKLQDRGASVHWTVGLPIHRTSPDHGTAFDLAGRGVADSASMGAAIDLAIQLAGPTEIPDPLSTPGRHT